MWKKVLTFIFFSIIILLILVFISPRKAVVIKNPNPEKSRQELRAAMKYHGVLFAFKENGKWYFLRDGKKCRLFSKKYQEKRRNYE